MPTRILILGGGFGGLYTALELDRTVAKRKDVEVVLINRDNFFLFTPMLHEVAASDLDITNIVNPLRQLLKRVRFFCGDVEDIDLATKTVRVWHGDDQHHHELAFDHVVIAPGSITNTYGLPGVEENARTMRTLGDAIDLRNRIIKNMEEADFECCKALRSRLLTFVIAGGGFAGVETAGAIIDFIHHALKFYPDLTKDQVRVVLAHSGETILPELSPKLGTYAQRILTKRGVDIRTNVRVASFLENVVTLNTGEQIETSTLIWTAGTSPNPVLDCVKCHKERGRLCVDECLRVIAEKGSSLPALGSWQDKSDPRPTAAASGQQPRANSQQPFIPGVWSLGDCAIVPNTRTGKTHPPTAQHAIREGKRLARNIAATIDGKPVKPFKFRTLGQLASLGRRTGVANIMGINFSGFIAWWLWRTIYLMKLPRLEKKVRVALDWTLDLFFSKDLVQFQTSRAPHVSNDGELRVHDVAAPQHMGSDVHDGMRTKPRPMVAGNG